MNGCAHKVGRLYRTLHYFLPTRQACWSRQLDAVSRFGPSLALVDQGKLFVQSLAHMIGKDGARAERYPKTIPKRY